MSAEPAAAGTVEFAEIPEDMDLLEFALIHNAAEEASRASLPSAPEPLEEAEVREADPAAGLNLTAAEDRALWIREALHPGGRDANAALRTQMANLGLALVRLNRRVLDAGLFRRGADARGHSAYHDVRAEAKRMWREARRLGADLHAYADDQAHGP
jgi:hypothetical protein